MELYKLNIILGIFNILKQIILGYKMKVGFVNNIH